MLSHEDNELLCRVGPGTPMGNLLREYWFPALPSREFPEPDCDVKRMRLLGEDIVMFRDTEGRMGAMAEACPPAPLTTQKVRSSIRVTVRSASIPPRSLSQWV